MLFSQWVKVPYAPRLLGEALASGKVVFREECTEGSQTAKVCTDEQVGLAVTLYYSQCGAYEAYLFG